MHEQIGQWVQPLLLRRGGIDLPNFRKRPSRLSDHPRRFIAAKQLQGFLGINCGQAVGFSQSPTIDKAVVTGSALHVDAKKRLRNVLRKLDWKTLSDANGPAPFDSINKTGAFRIGRSDQFTHHGVEGFVLPQGFIEPAADLLTTTCNKTRAIIVVAQQVIPECKPVLGVIDVSSEKIIYQSVALIGRAVSKERPRFLSGRQQPNQVE